MPDSHQLDASHKARGCEPAGREITKLMLLFGVMYVVQGIAEPTEGLIAQPVRSLLKSWDYSAAAIASFGALLSLPWSLKPIYGLLTDFVPLAGTRRRGYLILTSGASSAALVCLCIYPIPVRAHWQLLLLLLIPTTGVAFSDVVVDALMIEKGQARGLTGRLQSVQWAALYGGSIVAGLAGGYLSQHGLQREGFLLCGVTSSCTCVMAWLFVHEEPQRRQKHQLRYAVRQLIGVLRTRSVLAAAAFLFLWSFNPFSMSVYYLYLTQHLGISEQFYGVSVSLLSVGAIAGSLAYGTYCRRVPMPWLIHLSIAMGVLSTLAHCWIAGHNSAAIVSVIVGFTYLTGNMVQLDLAARACPIAVAGTTFALLMALSNLSLSLSAAIGGWLYGYWSAEFNPPAAFRILVVTGALSTSACWLLVPWLNSAIKIVHEEN